MVEWSVGDTRGRAGGGLHWAAGSTAEFNPDSVFDELCVLVTALSLLPAALPGVIILSLNSLSPKQEEHLLLSVSHYPRIVGAG